MCAKKTLYHFTTISSLNCWQNAGWVCFMLLLSNSDPTVYTLMQTRSHSQFLLTSFVCLCPLGLRFLFMADRSGTQGGHFLVVAHLHLGLVYFAFWDTCQVTMVINSYLSHYNFLVNTFLSVFHQLVFLPAELKLTGWCIFFLSVCLFPALFCDNFRNSCVRKSQRRSADSETLKSARLAPTIMPWSKSKRSAVF